VNSAQDFVGSWALIMIVVGLAACICLYALGLLLAGLAIAVAYFREGVWKK